MAAAALLSLQDLDDKIVLDVPVKLKPMFNFSVLCTDNARLSEAKAWEEALRGGGHTIADTPESGKVQDCETELVLYVGSYTSVANEITENKKVIFIWPAEEELRLMRQAEIKHKSLYEVWIYPQALTSASMIDVLTMNTRIRIVPQLWSATHILTTVKKTEEEFMYDATNRDSENGVDVVILSDLISSSSSILYPVLACELAEVADSKTIRNVIVTVSSASSLPSSTLFKNLVIGPKLKFVQCKVEDVVPYFMARKQYSVFLYHQMDRTESPELLWSLAYGGFPLIHNLKTSMQIGLRFVDNEVHKVAKFLSVKKESYTVDYANRNREALKSVNPEQQNVQLALQKIADEWSK